MKFIAFLTKGLNEVCRNEIKNSIVDVEIIRESDKYIVFSSNAEIEDLLDLRTVDDIQILLKYKEFDELNTDKVVRQFPERDLKEKIDLIKKNRDPGSNFSLTVSKYRNAVNKEKIESEIAEKISNLTGRSFTDGRESKLDIRIHVEEESLIISVRADDKPLYFRDYWEEGRKGSLKTSIAAALCQVAEPDEEDKIVDNFCGAGTILCEAAVQGLKPSGGDIEREAVKITRKNLSQVNQSYTNQIKKLDAASTDHPDNYFDIAVSNLPWGKQVELNETQLYRESLQEYSRILQENGKIVILGNSPELAEKHLRKNFPSHKIKSLELGFLGQKPSISYAKPE